MIRLDNIDPRRGQPLSAESQELATTGDRREPSFVTLQALSDTVGWCLSKSRQHDQLRSRELDPSAFLIFPSIYEVGVEVLIQRMHEGYEQAIRVMNQTRATLVRNTKIEAADLAQAHSKGKLLLYHPLETVSDGAAASSSHGFFDMEDAPPWNTWFLYSEGTIFSWVPESWARNAQAGIDANPVDCIHWCDWSRLSEPEKYSGLSSSVRQTGNS